MGWTVTPDALRALVYGDGPVPASCDHIPTRVASTGARYCGCGRVYLARHTMTACPTVEAFADLIRARLPPPPRPDPLPGVRRIELDD